MKKTHNKLVVLTLAVPLILFPFGEVLKFTITAGLKISLLEVTLFLIITYAFFKGRLSYKKSITAKSTVQFLLWCLVSIVINSKTLINSNQLLPAIFYTSRYILYFLYYLFILDLLEKDKNQFLSNKLSQYLFLSLSFIAIFGIIQYIMYPDLRNLLYLGWDPHYYRLFSTLFDPNFAGVVIVIAIIYFLSRSSAIKSIWQKMLVLLLFTTNSMALYLTRSRTAYLSLIIGLATFLIYKWRTKNNKQKNTANYPLYILLALLVIASGFLLPKPNVDVFRLFRPETSLSRLTNWYDSIKLGLSHPLVGIGFGSQRFADSSFFYVFYATGVVGLMLYIRIWYQIVKFAHKNNLVTLLSMTCVLLVSSFFNNTLFYTWILFIFYFMLALEESNTKVHK